MTILIITHSQDNESILSVMAAIEARGEKVFRFDTDKFPTEIQLDIAYSNGSQNIIIANEQQKLNLKEVSAVWYRRIAIGARIPRSMDKQLRQAAIQESRTTIAGMIASIKGFHLDKVVNIRLAENKQLQLQVAEEIGLKIPRTLITNNPEAVKQFAQECQQDIVTKMLSSFAIYDNLGQEKVVFTNPVTSEDINNLDGLNLCPMTFQEKISKALELRTIIVGDNVFTAAVDSQAVHQARYDWRREGVALINAWQPHDLPKDVEQKLLKLMAYFGLNYGAIDIILTPDGEYVFLEVNPVGEFFWLENSPGLPISQTIAELLINCSHQPKSLFDQTKVIHTVN
ncbi:glutathione synthase/ribosomal protein S6 modification enzyme (glutaminyl transferase) [Rivularia sp. PCC 7116]|uniref:MvdD family ATP-grasp ribosomal peptide maturase n=1 Tax=Rivularia sp. PCC 7116 TaxID=373994 RepID=UPI00029ED3BD|nr:MvdD family ATP-grasp ribosomal peptide maturase [Rivularia sp. PCC 7116]AFY55915.1 glutathione synthase/ribosomal protein S6 modification enzyme (glutaminyl transferase) [Rivularia sp. PCC 7116]